MFKLGEGEFSEVFRIEDKKVVKLFRKELFDEKAFEAEYKITKYLGETTDFTPKVYDKVFMDSRHGYVMEEIDGTLFMDVIESDGYNLSYYGDLLGKAHFKLHEKAITQELESLDRCKNFMANFLNRNEFLPVEVNRWLIKKLENINGSESLLHSDFMPNNIMFDEGELKVLDWAEPSLGPGILDVARTLNVIIDPTELPNSLLKHNSKIFARSYLKGYFLNADIDKEQLHDAFLINAACEIAWAERSNQVDDYSEYLKAFVMKNYHSKENAYLDIFEDL